MKLTGYKIVNLALMVEELGEDETGLSGKYLIQMLKYLK